MKKKLHHKEQVKKIKNPSTKSSKTKLAFKENKSVTDEEKELVKSHTKRRFYVGYFPRVLMGAIFFIILLCSSFYFLGNSIFITSSEKVSYTEKSNLDYRVYLKENDFYESEYLGKDMSYIASLIDYIDLFFDYDFDVDILMDANFDYKIVAVLTINNETQSSTYFSKEYTLLEKKNEKVSKANSFHINEKIQLDYDYYNKLANQFKATYGVGTSSNLEIYLKINRSVSTLSIDNHELDNQSSMSIHIPLSQKAISIQMNYDEIKNQDSVVSDGKVQITNVSMFFLGSLFFVLSIVLLVHFYRKVKVLTVRNNSYDKYIKKILKEYDRLIVVTETMPNLEKCQVYKLTDFNELLDVRDNTKKPIMYYNVIDHIKCYFYLKDNTDIYLLCIKAVDIDKNIENKKL